MKEILSIIAVILTFAAYIPYYRDIFKGKTQPHVYSWSLWGFLTILLVALQLKGGAGSAVWVTASAGLLCIGVVVLGLKNSKKIITKSDTIVAFLSLLAILFWLIIDKPIISLLLVIIADILAFVPTIRKSWLKPHTETLSMYVTNTFRFTLALAAVENYSFLSSGWIVTWILANGLFSLMLVVRRRQVAYP